MDAAEDLADGAEFLAVTFDDTLQMIGDRFVFGAIEHAGIGDAIVDNLDWETRDTINTALDEADRAGDLDPGFEALRMAANARDGQQIEDLIQGVLGQFREGNHNEGMERRGRRDGP